MKGCANIMLFIGAAAIASAAGGGMPDEGAVRKAFDAQVAQYLQTTGDDLKYDSRYPNVSVPPVSSDVRKTNSLVTPYAGAVKYLIEYDDPMQKGVRLTHPYLMRCSYFEGRWDIDPHGHRNKKNLEDLDKKETRMLYPNI